MKRRTAKLAIAIALGGGLALAAGCSKRAPEPPAPTCEQVTENLYKLTRIQFPGHGEEMAMGDRKRDVAACEARKYTPKERRCMAAAKTFQDLAACRKVPRGPRDKEEGATASHPAPSAAGAAGSAAAGAGSAAAPTK